MNSNNDFPPEALEQIAVLQHKVLALEYALRSLFVAASRIDNPQLFAQTFLRVMHQEAAHHNLPETQAGPKDASESSGNMQEVEDAISQMTKYVVHGKRAA